MRFINVLLTYLLNCDCIRQAAIFLFCLLGGDALALCHDKQPSDAHQPRPFDNANGQSLTLSMSLLHRTYDCFISNIIL